MTSEHRKSIAQKLARTLQRLGAVADAGAEAVAAVQAMEEAIFSKMETRESYYDTLRATVAAVRGACSGNTTCCKECLSPDTRGEFPQHVCAASVMVVLPMLPKTSHECGATQEGEATPTGEDAKSRKRSRDAAELDETEEGAPSYALCPITQAVMADPVVVSDGNSYERAAIETWMFQCGKMFSPLTRERLSGVVTPNRTLKTAIDVYWGRVEASIFIS